jgi:hypothetical protein
MCMNTLISKRRKTNGSSAVFTAVFSSNHRRITESNYDIRWQERPRRSDGGMMAQLGSSAVDNLSGTSKTDTPSTVSHICVDS